MEGERQDRAAADLSYDHSRVALIFMDDGAAREDVAGLVRALGGRVGATGPIEGAAAEIAARVGDSLVFADVAAADAAAGSLLQAVARGARAGRLGGAVAVPRSLIDAAVAALDDAPVALLCEPTRADRVAAIVAALSAPRRRYFAEDVDSDAHARRLQQLSLEVSRIAETLASLSDEPLERKPLARARQPARAGDRPVDAAQVRAIIRARRLRDQYFEAELFADPAWDMLLDLIAARLEGRQVAVSSLCIAAAVPPTTALRWIRMLTDGGIVERIADPRDGRRVFISLSDSAAEAMLAYLSAAQRLPGPAA